MELGNSEEGTTINTQRSKDGITVLSGSASKRIFKSTTHLNMSLRIFCHHLTLSSEKKLFSNWGSQ